MKKIILITSLALLSVNASAFTIKDLTSPTSQKIMGGCGAGLLVSTLMGSDIGVGLGICAGFTAFALIDDSQREQSDKVALEMKGFLENSKKEMLLSQTKMRDEYVAYQEAIRKIVLEKLAEMQGFSDKHIETYMKTPQFESFVKKQATDILSGKDGVLSEGLTKISEDIRRRVTEDVLRDYIEAQGGSQ